MRSGAPLEVIENLQEMEDEGDTYECIEDIWPDYPSKEHFFFNEEEYCLTHKGLTQKNTKELSFAPATAQLFFSFAFTPFYSIIN